MISADIQYEINNDRLLIIVEAFKTLQYYIKVCKYKIFIFTDHNNLCRFMVIKKLSSRQVCWAQKFSQYHFEIDYYQDKANAATKTLS